MRYFVTLGERTLVVEVGPDGVSVEGRPCQADLLLVPGSPEGSLLLDGASHRVLARAEGKGRWDVQLDGRRLAVTVVDERQKAIRELTGSGAARAGPRPVRAPMPGLVVRVEVEVGESVEPGQGLVIVEAMKMENELRAEAAGRVKNVWARAGETVEKDQVLVDFEAEEPAGS